MTQLTKEEALAKFKAFWEQEVLARQAYKQAVEEDSPNIDDDSCFDASDDEDWHSLALGFFAALGFNAKDSLELSRKTDRLEFYYR